MISPPPASAAALEDSRSALSACMPALSGRVVQDLSESCFSYLKGALEVPRLYRRTNKVSAIHQKELCGGKRPEGLEKRARCSATPHGFIRPLRAR